jgi:hypothetical protein
MPNFAFLSQGRLHLHREGKPAEIQSRFGDTIRERALASERRHAWKSGGAGSRFMGLWAPRVGESAEDMAISITALAPGNAEGELLYTLETTEICGLLQVNDFGSDEQRLWHSNQTRIRDLARHPSEPRVACAVWEPNGTANIGVMTAEGSRLREVTEGDSLDLSPRWVAGESEVLVYQSAGLGRNRQGHPVAYGPFEIHRLDLTSGDLDTLVASPRHDYLAPRGNADGTLHFIRRPHEDPFKRTWWQVFVDLLLIPFRLLAAIFQFFNVFTMLFTGKPLASRGGAAKGADLKRMMLWGNAVEAEKAMRAAPQEEAPDLVPKTWELIRRTDDGAEAILVRGVIAYDLLPDGSLLYTNGSAIFHRTPDGKTERLLKHHYIEQVIALS